MTDRSKGVKLADAGKLFAAHTSDNMRDRVLAFIIEYQDQHTGNTPTVDLMARQLNTVPQAIRGMLARLETARKIHVVSRNPLRIVVMQRDTVLPHEQGSDTGIADPKRFDRLLEADGTRHGLARWIGQHNEAFGRGPTLREAMNYLNLTNGGWVNRQLEILAERGLIKYGVGKNTELTESGRVFYRVAPTKPAPVIVVPTKPKEEEPVFSNKNQKLIDDRSHSKMIVPIVEGVGKFIYEWQRDKMGTSPEYDEIRAGLGMKFNSATLTAALVAMEREGWLKPRKPASKRSIFLTDAGKERFGPPPVAAPEPEVEAPLPKPVVERPQPQTYGDIGPAVMDWVAKRQAELPPSLSNVATADLIMELIERGYVVRK